jgi:hypothetical protein
MKKTISSFFLLLSAQGNYKSGYIITNENDTLRGFVNFRNDEINARQCSFKIAENAEVRDYAPGEIKAYRLPVESRYYITRTVPLKRGKATVFLEYLVQGKMNMYYYRQDDQIEYYYAEKEDGILYPITQNEDEIIDGKIRPDNKYKGLLSFLMQDASGMEKSIMNTQFDRRSMVKLSKEYHEETCEPGEECIVFENDYEKTSTQFRFSAYAGWNSYSFGKTSSAKFDKGSPTVGVQLQISNPRLSNHLNLVLDASISRITANDYYEWSSGINIFRRDFEHSINTFNAALGLKYDIL